MTARTVVFDIAALRIAQRLFRWEADPVLALLVSERFEADGTEQEIPDGELETDGYARQEVRGRAIQWRNGAAAYTANAPSWNRLGPGIGGPAVGGILFAEEVEGGVLPVAFLRLENGPKQTNGERFTVPLRDGVAFTLGR